MKNIIMVSNLSKQYGESKVLNDISFNIETGSIFALLGTNGAGKTTALECIEGLRKYDSGEIIINGKIGVQLQSASLPEGIRVNEALKLYSKWNGENVDYDFIDRLGIRDILKKEYKSLSTGQKRRLHLALAMTGNPEIIFLDEPTAGLDVEGRSSLHEEIRRLNLSGKTIVLASHDMAEVESLCDKLAILKNGKIAFLGTVEELTKSFNSCYKVLLKADKNLSGKGLAQCKYNGENKDYYVYECEVIDSGMLEILTLARGEGLVVYDIKIESSKLEDSFMDIARGEK
ncbi:MAG: ABC transporter ATP-binding protein [Clostridium sp.]